LLNLKKSESSASNLIKPSRDWGRCSDAIYST
jgi:hypothetical protein